MVDSKGRTELLAGTEAAGTPCAICGAERATFRDLPDRPKASCTVCHSLERHRAFAHAYHERLESAGGFEGLRVLVLRPSATDLVMLEKFSAAEVVGFDAMPGRLVDVQGDPTAMDFPDASFDVVISNGLLASIADPAAAIRELGRVLKKSGLIFVYESVMNGRPTMVVSEREQRATLYGEEVFERHGVGKYRTWNALDLEAALAQVFKVQWLETADPGSNKEFLWCVAAHLPLPDEIFTDRSFLFVPSQAPDPPPYLCSICGATFEQPVSRDRCPTCSSPGRARALPEIVRDHVARLADPALAARLPLLALSMSETEERALAPVFHSFTRASYFGRYGEGTLQGVDVRDLSRFAPDSFSGAVAVGVFDYFVEQEQALEELYRVIAPGGVLIALFQPERLRCGSNPPVATKIERATGKPDEIEIISVRLGREWYLDAMRRGGFEAHSPRTFDPASGITNTWFLGRKPA